MPAVSKHTRNFTVLFLTSLGIVAFMLFYIFGYIPENESRINTRSYRVLQRIGDNMSVSVVNYATKVGSSYVSYTVKKTLLSPDLPNQPLSKDSVYLNYNFLKNQLNQRDKADKLTGKFGIRYKFLDEDLSDSSSQHFESNGLIHYSEEKGVTHIDFRSRLNETLIKELREAKIKIKGGPDDYNFDLKVPIDSMLIPLMRWDTFTHLVVLRRNEPTKQEVSKNQSESNKAGGAEKSQQPESTYKVLYNSGQNADILPVDTLGYLAHQSSGKSPVNVMIAGVPYKMYSLTQRIGSDDKWYLFGTIPTEKFDAESRAIPADAISFAALAFIILLMAFPFLKLVLMSQQERLYIKDVVFSFISLFVGLALIILLLFDSYAFYGVDKSVEHDRLKNLSAGIASNLRQEIKILLSQLQFFDRCTTNVEDCTTANNPFWKQVKANQIERANDRIFPNFQRVFWTDANGTMVTSWTAQKGKYVNNAKVPVGTRDYFKIINSGGGWSLDNDSLKFALESITSFTDGEKYAVISAPSEQYRNNNKTKDLPIVALATKLTSVHKPVLPPGYGFCIIDKEGKVLFHQNENLNLNENLLEETNYDPHLKAALYGKVPAYFIQNYQGSPQQLYVAPIKDLPYFLVTFVNEAFHKSFNVNLLVLTAMFLSIYLFSLAIISGFTIWFNKGFSGILFKWLWPKQNANLLYAKIILTISATIVLTWGQTNTNNQVSSFFIFLFAAVYILVFIYSTLNKIQLLKSFKCSLVIILSLNFICLATSVPVFARTFLFQMLLTVLFFSIDKYWQDKKTWEQYNHNKIIQYLFSPQKRTLRLYVLMIACWLILTSALPALTLFRVAYNYEADLMVRYNQMHLAQTLSEIKNDDSPNNFKTDSTKLITNTRLSYTNFFYHTKGAVNEAPLPPVSINKYAKDFTTKEAFPNTLGDQNNELSGVLNERDNSEPDVLAESKETILLNSIISIIRPIFRNALSDEYYLKSNDVNFWQYVGKHNLRFQANDGAHLYLNSHLPKFEIPPFFYPSNINSETQQPFPFLNQVNKSAFLFWGDVIVLLILLYLLLSFLIIRLFNPGLVADLQFSLGNLKLLDPAFKNNLFVISLPQSQNIKEVIRSIANQNSVVFAEINLKNLTLINYENGVNQKLPNTLKRLKLSHSLKKIFHGLLPKHKWLLPHLIIKNFDHDPFSKESLEFKISFLHEINQLTEVKTILQSTLNPSCWEERLNEEKQKGDGKKDDGSYRAVLQEFVMELNAYTKVYQPLQRYEPNPEKVEEEVNVPLSDTVPEQEMKMLQLIKEECKASAFLEKHYAPILYNNLGETMAHYYTKESNYNTPNQDERTELLSLKEGNIILRLQSLAKLYYQSLWDSCSEEEHYFLYDIAQDGLVNSKNERVLSSLLGKGLLVTSNDGLLKVMNESFRCFIRTAVNPTEALRYEKSMAQGSSWEIYKTPLVLILVGAVLFFFFTQKSSWANIIAILTAMSTFLSILPRLSFLVPSFIAAKEAKNNE